MDGELRRLAEICGLSLGYHDAWGHWRDADAAAVRALLQSLGYLGAEGDVDAAIAAREAARWAHFAPPVRVVREGGAVEVELCVDADTAPGRLTWCVTTEAGQSSEGRLDAGTLERIESAVVEGRALARLRLVLPATLEAGYHRLEIRMDAGPQAGLPLICAPARCHLPEALAQGRRLWGPALQLYALRSARNWGMGDFADLRAAIALLGARGAGLFGLNPMHAPFLANPAHASPYSPSSRLFLNPLYLAVDEMEDFAESAPVRAHVGEAAFRLRLDELRATPEVDYAGVAAAKLEVLRRLWTHFRTRHLAANSERAADYQRFVREGGDALQRHARFEAIHGGLRAADAAVWNGDYFPPELAGADTPAVARFAAEHDDEVGFQLYLQWQTSLQLAACARCAAEAGAPVGLYLDLAVSCDGGGSDVWGAPDLFVKDVAVGAPPDDFNPRGQNWGLPPFHPERLREEGYGSIIALLRANMSRAGALRIDHVMGLLRLYCVPAGFEADQGIYLLQPFDDLMGIVALESRRNRCLVVGEDLGTVPDQVREAMHRLGLLSYRLFYFQKEWSGEFLAPEHYPAEALVAVSTHDLPTLRGWWVGRDLDLRRQLGLFPSPEVEDRQCTERVYDRYRLLRALKNDGLLPAGVGEDPAALPTLNTSVALAVHARLARAPSRLMMVQMEEVLGVSEQANLPGTTEESHPNWRRKLPVPIEAWNTLPALKSLVDTLCRAQRCA